jgi:biopolymer transport protein ExbD
MNSANSSKRAAVPYINVTPLIDILLVLLIIFMIISPARPNKFDAKIPEKPKPEDKDINHDMALVVTINRDGGYALNTQPASTLEELQSLLSRAVDGRPEGLKAVFLKAPRTLRYGEVVRVVDVVKASGGAPIGLQADALDQ